MHILTAHEFHAIPCQHVPSSRAKEEIEKPMKGS